MPTLLLILCFLVGATGLQAADNWVEKVMAAAVCVGSIVYAVIYWS